MTNETAFCPGHVHNHDGNAITLGRATNQITRKIDYGGPAKLDRALYHFHVQEYITFISLLRWESPVHVFCSRDIIFFLENT
jgi:hypothetical protein